MSNVTKYPPLPNRIHVDKHGNVVIDGNVIINGALTINGNLTMNSLTYQIFGTNKEIQKHDKKKKMLLNENLMNTLNRLL